MRDMWQMLRSHYLGLIKHIGENLHVGGLSDSSHHTFSTLLRADFLLHAL